MLNPLRPRAITVTLKFNFCEAQGKGRVKGQLRKVTQRSFIDINFPEALH